MIEKAKRVMNKGGHFSAPLSDQSKAFDSLFHNSIIAKLGANGFQKTMLFVTFNYLLKRKQRVKINSSFSSFQNIISGVLQGSLLGSLLFNIFRKYIFLFCVTEIAIFADGNTSYATRDCLKKIYKK